MSASNPDHPTFEMTEANFESAINKGGIVLIDFWAAWCGPCRAFAPVYEAAAKKHPDITFAKVNTEEQQALAASFDIQAIPTIAIFRDRVLLFAQAGAVSGAGLEDLITQVQALDMTKVHAEIAEQQKKAPPTA